MRTRPSVNGGSGAAERRFVGAGVRHCLRFAWVAALTASSGIVVAQDLPLPDAPISIEGESARIRLVETRRLALDESLTLLSDAHSLDFFDDGSFVIVSNQVAGVVIYEADGTQRRVLGNWGPGPGEYESPSIARVNGSTVFVRDNARSKYVAYDSSGAFAGEWTGHAGGPSDFAVAGKWIVALTGQDFEYLVKGFRIDGADDSLRAAPTNVEVASLHVVVGAGAAASDGRRFFYAYPNENAFRFRDLETREEREVRLPTDGFRISPYPFVGFEDINRSFGDDRMFRYVIKNSRTEGVRVIDDFVVAIRSDGEMPADEFEQVPTSRQRKRRYFVHDHTLRLIDTVSLELEHMRALGYSEAGTGENSLVFVTEASADAGRTVAWTLTELEFQQIRE